MGGAGASVAPQPADDKFWIVKDGVVQLPFDDTVYQFSPDYTAVATQWSYSSSNNVLSHATNMGNGKSCGYITSNEVDVSQYSALTIVYRALSTESTFSVRTFDISNVIVSAYLAISLATSGTTGYLDVIFASQKNNYAANRLALLRFATLTVASGVSSHIKDIYLEKKENLLPPLNSLLLTQPSDTSTANSTKRLWTKNTYIKGLSRGNYYYITNITSYSSTENTFNYTTSSTSYGCGIVLSDEVKANKTYKVSYSCQYSNMALSVAYYKADGTFINYLRLGNSGEATFTVPNETEYVLLVSNFEDGTHSSGTTTINFVMAV